MLVEGEGCRGEGVAQSYRGRVVLDDLGSSLRPLLRVGTGALHTPGQRSTIGTTFCAALLSIEVVGSGYPRSDLF